MSGSVNRATEPNVCCAPFATVAGGVEGRRDRRSTTRSDTPIHREAHHADALQGAPRREASGLPAGRQVGSGVVETACKTLASERLKRSGMSWREPGLQAIVTFRSLLQSDRWDRAWQLLANEYKSDVVAA